MKNAKRMLALILALAMILTTFGVTVVSAAQYSDTSGHWAESYIDTWTNNGVIQGDGGYFRPDDAITRAEVAQVTQNVIGYVDTVENTFTDIDSSDWYADAVLKLVAAGTLTGNGDGTMRPNDYMTREEAMTMLARAYGLTVENSNAGITQYSDYESVSEYANGYVGAMTAAGYVNGYEDGTVRPQANISRAEFVKILDNMIKLYITQPGTYGPAYTGGIVMVKSGDVTLDGIVANGIVISPEVSGDVDISSQVSGQVVNLSKTANVTSNTGGNVNGETYSTTTNLGSGGSSSGSSSSSNKITVRFYDSTTASSPSKTVSIRKGAKVSGSVPDDPEKDGYEFKGWYDSKSEANNAEKYNPLDLDNSTFSKNTSLYAGYVALATADPNATATPNATEEPTIGGIVTNVIYSTNEIAESSASLTESGYTWNTSDADMTKAYEELGSPFGDLTQYTNYASGDLETKKINILTEDEYTIKMLLGDVTDKGYKVSFVDASGNVVATADLTSADGRTDVAKLDNADGNSVNVAVAQAKVTLPAGEYTILFENDDASLFIAYQIDGAESGPIATEEPTATSTPSTDVTAAPATEAPSTNPDVTAAPATEAPSTNPDVTAAPATEAPSANPDVTEAPATEAPSANPDVTEAPATEAPSANPDVTAAPATEAPSANPDVTEAPATEAPATTDPNATTAPKPGVDDPIVAQETAKVWTAADNYEQLYSKAATTTDPNKFNVNNMNMDNIYLDSSASKRGIGYENLALEQTGMPETITYSDGSVYKTQIFNFREGSTLSFLPSETKSGTLKIYYYNVADGETPATVTQGETTTSVKIGNVVTDSSGYGAGYAEIPVTAGDKVTITASTNKWLAAVVYIPDGEEITVTPAPDATATPEPQSYKATLTVTGGTGALAEASAAAAATDTWKAIDAKGTFPYESSPASPVVDPDPIQIGDSLTMAMGSGSYYINPDGAGLLDIDGSAITGIDALQGVSGQDVSQDDATIAPSYGSVFKFTATKAGKASVKTWYAWNGSREIRVVKFASGATTGGETVLSDVVSTGTTYFYMLDFDMEVGYDYYAYVNGTRIGINSVEFTTEDEPVSTEYEFPEGVTVKYTGTPTVDGQVATVKVTAADGTEIAVADDTFTMPSQDVTVDVTYAEAVATPTPEVTEAPTADPNLPADQSWTSLNTDLMTAATSAGEGTAFGPIDGLSGYGQWKSHSSSATYTHTDGTTYTFTTAFQAGSGGKTKRCFYFTPQQACIVTVAYAAQATRPVYIYQGSTLLASGEEGATGGVAATITADIEDPAAGDVYVYGGSSNKDIYGIFADYYDPTVITEQTLSGNLNYSGSETGLYVRFTDTKDGNTTDVNGNTYQVPLVNGEYSINLRQNRTYDITVVDADGNVSDKVAATLATNSVSIAKMAKTQDIDLVDIAVTNVTGDVVVHDYNNDGTSLDLSGVTLTFTAQDDASYTYTTTVTNNTISVDMMPNHVYDITATGIDGYELSTLSQTYTMAAGDTSPFKNILIEEVLGDVAYSATVQVGTDKAYATISDAVAAIAKMTDRPSGEDGRVTVEIDPGTYTEQVTIAPSYVTLKGTGTEPGDTQIQWYYGIGYLYYSSASTGYYSLDDAVQKTDRGTVNRWGTACRPTGSYVYLENLNITNTFNCFVSDAELADGVQPALNNEYSDTNGKPDRTVEGYDAMAKNNATERAAAITLDGGYSELYNCEFVSSQDTFYTNKVAYVKDCYIEGGTDYIFGGNSVLFEDCTLAWHGYSDQSVGGYLTACKTSGAAVAGEPSLNTNGYMLRDCTVTNSKYYTSNKFAAGSWGRNWGGASCQVVFDGITMDGVDLPGEWVKMGGDLSTSVLYVTDVTDKDGNAVDVSGTAFNPNGTMESNGYTELTDYDYLGEWDPPHYEGEIVRPTADPDAPIKMDFTDAANKWISSTTAASEDYVLEDGKVTIDKNAVYHNDHGLSMPAGDVIKIVVDGPTDIAIGSCQYSGADVTLTDADGNTIGTTQLGKNSSTLAGICWKNDNSNVATLSYYGPATTLTINLSAGVYFPYLGITKTGEYDPDATATPAPQTATLTYDLGDSGAEGTAPSAETVNVGETCDIPYNKTVYLSGKTLIGWTDGTNTYATGETVTMDADKTVTPKFMDNPDEVPSGEVTFYLGESNGAPGLALEGSTGILVAQPTGSMDVKLDIDATSGKCNNKGRGDQWAQVNTGTKFTVSVVSGTVVTVGDVFGNATYTINGVEKTGDNGSETMTEAGTCEIIATSSDYWTSITVTYPDESEDEPDATAEPTAEPTTVADVDIAVDFTNEATNHKIFTSDETVQWQSLPDFAIAADGTRTTTDSDTAVLKFSGYKFHSDQYGIVPGTMTVDVSGPTKISIGNCNFGGDITITDLNGNVVNASNKADNTYDSSNQDRVATAYYAGTEATTLTISGGNYVGYYAVKSIDASEIPASYNVNVADTENGTVSVDKTSTMAGQTVTITATPADGYVVDTVSVKDASDNDVTVTAYAFDMPESDVTVTVTFKLQPTQGSSIDYQLDLKPDGDIGTTQQDWTLEDGFVVIKSMKSDNSHGAQGSGPITVQVPGSVKIEVGTCAYDDVKVVVTDADGNTVATADDIIGSQQSLTDGTQGTYGCDETVTLNYTGDATTLTISFESSTSGASTGARFWLPFLNITSVTE